MTCDVCLDDSVLELFKRLDDSQEIWYCNNCRTQENKRIWQTKRANNLAADKALVRIKK